MISSLRLPTLAALFLVFLCSFPAPVVLAGEANVDPWERTNRKTHGFNDRFDRWLLKPVAKAYNKVVPAPIKRGVSNVFRNVGTPAVALNQLLQGKGKESASDVGRFLINSTIGIAGIFDVASPMGLEAHEEDFGQTFAVWGVADGPYFVIPFRGPSTTTHAFGMLLDSLINPLRLISPDEVQYGTWALYFVDLRVDALAAESLLSGDEYLFLRDAYLQNRAYLINDGEVEEADPFLDDF